MKYGLQLGMTDIGVESEIGLPIEEPIHSTVSSQQTSLSSNHKQSTSELSPLSSPELHIDSFLTPNSSLLSNYRRQYRQERETKEHD